MTPSSSGWSLVVLAVAVGGVEGGTSVMVVSAVEVDDAATVSAVEVDDAATVDGAVTVDGLSVDGLSVAVGLCHGGFRNTGNRGVDRGSCIAVETVPGVMAVAIVMAWPGSWPR